LSDILVDETTDRYGRKLDPDPEATRLLTDPVRVHVVTMRPSRYLEAARRAGCGVSWHDRGHWETDHVLAVDTRNGNRWAIGYCDDTSLWNVGNGSMSRRQGRQGYLFALASVIAANGRGTAWEAAENRKLGQEHDAAVGDYVVLVCDDGDRVVETTMWRIVPDGYRGSHVTIELVQR
jgi:hypothetical protein